jgi:hypothetical protein
MRLRPADGVTAYVLADGRLELHLKSSAYHCGPARAAMWLALLQNGGDQGAAADMLAELWDIDPVNMRADVTLWTREMCDAGLLRIEY